MGGRTPQRGLEWAGYVACFISLTAEVFSISMPGYNFVLGWWAIHSSYATHGRGLFAFLVFCAYSLLTDSVYVYLGWGSELGLTTPIAMGMLGLNALVKLHMLRRGYRYFVRMGGALSMDVGFCTAATSSVLQEENWTERSRESDAESENGGEGEPPDTMGHARNNNTNTSTSADEESLVRPAGGSPRRHTQITGHISAEQLQQGTAQRRSAAMSQPAPSYSPNSNANHPKGMASI